MSQTDPFLAADRESRYVDRLLARWAIGAIVLPKRGIARHGDFLAAAQQPDGGFAGRKGQSDCYYTAFGLQGLAAVGRLDDSAAARAAAFLAAQLDQPLPPADRLSLLSAAMLLKNARGLDVFAAVGQDPQLNCKVQGEGVRSMISDEDLRPSQNLSAEKWTRPRTLQFSGRDPAAVLAQLAAELRRPGGYAKTPRSGPASTYLTYLMVTSLQVHGLPVPEPDAIVRAVLARQRSDGGFSEQSALRHSGTNPTAAAIGTLRALAGLDQAVAARTADYLVSAQTAQGGFIAHPRIGVPDLLSTLTALVTAVDLDPSGASNRAVPLDLPAMRRFVESLEMPTGGFRAAAWDDTADVEYTFYGLGSLILLS